MIDVERLLFAIFIGVATAYCAYVAIQLIRGR